MSRPTLRRSSRVLLTVLVTCGLVVVGCVGRSGAAGPSVVTVGFGTGGSECSLTGEASTFAYGIPVRVVVTFSPELPTGSTVTVTMTRDGIEIADAQETLTADEPTPCIYATLADLEVGHYELRYAIAPSSMPPASGEFDVTR